MYRLSLGNWYFSNTRKISGLYKSSKDNVLNGKKSKKFVNSFQFAYTTEWFIPNRYIFESYSVTFKPVGQLD